MKTPSSLLPLLVSPLLLSLGCHLYSDGSEAKDPNPGIGAGEYELVKDLLPAEVQDVDLLFVIDNSGSMQEEQESLAAWADESLFGVLGMPDGSPLDLHVAVVSTDLGAGPYGIQGCEAQGDGGQFLTGAANQDCTAIPGGFLSDIDDLQGGRLTNYSGTLSEAFACLAKVGSSGCGFEQPLEAMRRALDGTNPANLGFLREDALLAVVLISDEDDCSAFDASLFDSDPSLDHIGSPLGPLSSYRCFDFGVQCADDDPRTPGSKADCVERANSAYLASVGGYADFLKGLKSDPNMVYVAGIFGEAGTVSVSLSEGDLVLDPSCVSAGGEASPGVRLQSFLDIFPDRNRFASVCSENMSGPLSTAAVGINATVGRSMCLHGAIRDTNGGLAGVQAECRATVKDLQAGGAAATTLVRCGTEASGPCYELRADAEACAGTASKLALDLSRAGSYAEGHQIEVACQLL